MKKLIKQLNNIPKQAFVFLALITFSLSIGVLLTYAGPGSGDVSIDYEDPVGFSYIDFDAPCVSGFDWFDPFNNAAPCGPLHSGNQPQAKGGNIIQGSLLHINGRYAADYLKSYNGLYSKNISTNQVEKYESLCTDELGFGKITKCRIGNGLSNGNIDETLRFNSGYWLNNDFLSIKKDKVVINEGSGSVPVNPNTPNVPVVLSINGNIQIKGINYKSTTDTDAARVLVDTGNGVGSWKNYYEILSDSLVKVSYVYSGTGNSPAKIKSLGILCPVLHPKAILGNGSCGDTYISDSEPLNTTCRDRNNCKFELDTINGPATDLQRRNGSYPAIYAPQPVPSIEVPLEEIQGWFVTCSNATSNLEVFAICTK